MIHLSKGINTKRSGIEHAYNRKKIAIKKHKLLDLPGSSCIGERDQNLVFDFAILCCYQAALVCTLPHKKSNLKTQVHN
jgi:hypothetical protein